MSERSRSPLNVGQVQLAKRHLDLLEALDTEFPEPFTSRAVKARFDDIDSRDLLKLKMAGLLTNEPGARDEPKNWFLSQNTKRWLKNR